MCSQNSVSNPIYLIRVVLVQQTPCERPNANKHPCDRWDPCAKEYSGHSLNYLPSVCGPSANLVCKRIFVSFEKFVFKNIVFKPPVSAPPRTKIREIGEIRMPNKNIRVIRVIRVQKIQYEIRVPHKNIRVIPKATLDFFMGFFDMIVAGRTDYALMTEALLVKPV